MISLQELLLLVVVERHEVRTQAGGTEPVDDRLDGGHLVEVRRAPDVHMNTLKSIVVQIWKLNVGPDVAPSL